MTTEDTATAVNRAVKKTAKKQSTKAKKAAKKGPGREKKEGLRKPQIRVLKSLKGGKVLSRKQIAEKPGNEVDLAMLNCYIGSNDEAKRKANDKRYFPSLLTLGFIRPAPVQNGDKDGTGYEITASGKKALDKADSE